MSKSEYVKGQTGGHNQEGRPDKDFYETPAIAVEKLLAVEAFRFPVWEPACGAGAIVRVLENHGHSVFASDLYDHGFGLTGQDFFNSEVRAARRDTYRNIITNPPFSEALEFARTGVEYIEQANGKMALLLRLAWLEAQRRREFFETSPLSKVWVFSARLPMMHRPGWEGKKIDSGMIAYAWFVWQAGWNRAPEIGWI